MKLYREPSFPVELAIPLDHILQAKATCDADTYVFVGNPNGYRLGLGQRTRAYVFDLPKLWQDGIYVEKRPYAGSGFLCGPDDVYFSVHINRASLDDPQEPVESIFHWWHNRLRFALEELGIMTYLHAKEEKQASKGVCMNLSGQKEIVDKDGHKLVAGVYKDDGLVVSMSGVVLVSPAWLRVYDYLTHPPPKKMVGRCLQDYFLPNEPLTERVIDLLCGTLDNPESMRLSDDEWAMLRHLVKKFKVE